MENRDHKEIGRKLGLFSFSQSVPGTVFWWPKGTILFNLIVDDLRKKLDQQGYQELLTPTIINLETLKNSGHYENYRDKLFFVGSEKEINDKKLKWNLKPMNCPGCIAIFNEEMRSYKDLPLKYSEVGTVYRYEQPGEVNGLFRSRALTIDDAHIFCAEDQIENELEGLIEFVYEVYKKYGFKDISIELSTRPGKSIGTDKAWQKAEGGLKKALQAMKIEYKENKGEGAFYGPKIDFHIKDSLGRSWQMGTIQLDFATAERLEANYIDAKGQKKIPVIIHRAILGSVGRFIAVLLENNGGSLPVWLSPVQAIILSVSDKHNRYANEVLENLKKENIRVELDQRNESVSKKIHDAEVQKIPYIIVVGDKEEKEKNITVRLRGQKDLKKLNIEELIKEIKK